MDLGAWADESYTIKGKPVESDDDLFVSEETMDMAKYDPKKKSSAR